MAKDAIGWEWGHAKQLRAKFKHEAAQRRERKKAERAAQLEAKHRSIEEKISWSIEETWTIGGSGGAVFYVYVLERLPTNSSDKVRYVGATDDPRRRYLEHRRCGRLGDTDFRMVVVGEVRFPITNGRTYSMDRSRFRQIGWNAVRKAEKKIADLYREKGFELVNAD